MQLPLLSLTAGEVARRGAVPMALMMRIAGCPELRGPVPKTELVIGDVIGLDGPGFDTMVWAALRQEREKAE